MGTAAFRPILGRSLMPVNRWSTEYHSKGDHS